MDEAPYTGDMDLGAVATRDDLLALLRTVHTRADKSYRILEANTRHGATPLKRTVVSDMLSGKRFPHKAVMTAFLRACGVPDDDLEPWRHAWERVVSGRKGPAQLEVAPSAPVQPATEMAAFVDPAEVSQLREQINHLTEANELLRSQLAMNRRQSAEELQPDEATEGREPPDAPVRQSMWHFPGRSRVTLVSYRTPSDERPPSADPDNPNYVRLADLAGLDTVIDVYGAIKAYNPTSQVVITAAQDLRQLDFANHLVLIGGLTWKAVTPWFSRTFPAPIEPVDPFDRGAIVVQDPDSGEREFKNTFLGKEIAEDVGFLIHGKNPSAPRRTLTICGGITTRGVRGAALCFIDPEMRERNEEYLTSRFAAGSSYCIVMRVPIVNKDPLTPDLSKERNRLFEWTDDGSKAE